MDALYLLLVAGLAVTGLACLVLAATGFGGNNRVVTGLIGLASIGYAGYLFFSTGEVVLFYFAIAIPILTIVSAVRAKMGGPRRA